MQFFSFVEKERPQRDTFSQIAVWGTFNTLSRVVRTLLLEFGWVKKSWISSPLTPSIQAHSSNFWMSISHFWMNWRGKLIKQPVLEPEFFIMDSSYFIFKIGLESGRREDANRPSEVACSNRKAWQGHLRGNELQGPLWGTERSGSKGTYFLYKISQQYHGSFWSDHIS